MALFSFVAGLKVIVQEYNQSVVYWSVISIKGFGDAWKTPEAL
jgi:hypothetical protein